MWRVRRKNERHFNQGFHVINKDAAEALVKLLNEADEWKAEAERWRGGGWQPIETAPKDGTRIIGSHREWVEVLEASNGAWFQFDLDCFTTYHPTHWMPLPEPPR
jgi:hypothetical protein